MGSRLPKADQLPRAAGTPRRQTNGRIVANRPIEMATAEYAAQLSEALSGMARQARRRGLGEVAHMIEVASLAAEEARIGEAEAADPQTTLRTAKRFYSA
ncbi:MAG TPA: hypothetical protein VLL72_09265 [Kiloniellales bacterium]|nr:hypothetical protein [Kiloniellales bacterium]